MLTNIKLPITFNKCSTIWMYQNLINPLLMNIHTISSLHHYKQCSDEYLSMHIFVQPYTYLWWVKGGTFLKLYLTHTDKLLPWKILFFLTIYNLNKSCGRVPIFPITWQYWMLSFFFILSLWKKNIVCIILNCISLIISKIGHLSMCLLAT